MIEFVVDGVDVSVPDDGASLLGTLRDRLGNRSPKDGCSPQGQCGCCTVLVDGQPRVACVTPTRRVAGRTVTTLDGFPEHEQQRWANAFCATGASQCGFCTPGIIVRLAGLEAKKPDATKTDVDKALAAHLCRCTGWQTIHEAWEIRNDPPAPAADRDAGNERARLEGGVPQRISPQTALGHGGFADDTAPDDALVAVLGPNDEWVVGETLHEARQRAGKVQGRRTTLEPHYPLDVPEGEWIATLQTTWTDPAYLETDAAWARPGEAAVSALANGGAFGAKQGAPFGLGERSGAPIEDVAERLANEYQRPVRALYSREDAVRLGPKRPPVAGGIRADGSGILRLVAVPPMAADQTIEGAGQSSIDSMIAAIAPDLELEYVELANQLPTSPWIRGVGVVEALSLRALACDVATEISDGYQHVEISPNTDRVTVRWVDDEGLEVESEVSASGIRVRVGAGPALDETVLRSYCIGAAHMATSLVRSEALTVDEAGQVHDLTIRSFGILKASEMPPVQIEIVEGHDAPAHMGVSDRVFATVAAATSKFLGASRWPHRG